MKLTDEKIMELAKLNCSIHGYVFPVPFARAIEAEATKPQEQQEYGCYCELGPDDEPDSCVIGTGREGVTK